MAQTVNDVMTKNPRTFDAGEPVVAAARAMRDDDIGAVIVMDANRVRGIVTDRDITVRAVAEGRDPNAVTLGETSSGDVETVTPATSIDEAVRIMRERAVRRVPVVDNGQPVGIVSIGDLAMERDSSSALADISAAPPNR
jgi:CBS domain-containing protein